jgi:ribosomal protein S18 acetylase RimI-like enzyme
MFSIYRAGIESMETLRELAIRTFEESYSEHNDPEDIESYLVKSFAPATVVKELLHAGTEFYICYFDNRPVGYIKLNYDMPCEARPDLHAAELQRIYVLKEFQDRKAGKELLSRAMDVSLSRGFSALWLGVWKENKKALGFYFSKGFEIAGERSFILGKRLCEDYYLVKAL